MADITQSLLKTMRLVFMLNREEYFLTLYRVRKTGTASYWLRTNRNIRVMLFNRSSPINLLNWFSRNRNTIPNLYSLIRTFWRNVILNSPHPLRSISALNIASKLKLLLEELTLSSAIYLRQLTSGGSYF